MSTPELIAALVDARLFGLKHEEHVLNTLKTLGVNIRFASEMESEVHSE